MFPLCNALHKFWQEGQQLQLKEFLASEKIWHLWIVGIYNQIYKV